MYGFYNMFLYDFTIFHMYITNYTYSTRAQDDAVMPDARTCIGGGQEEARHYNGIEKNIHDDS